MQNQLPPRSIAKTIFAVVFSVYFLWCALAPESVIFMHLVHLPIHEAGHVFFSVFGRWMGVAGGSLFQVMVPLVFFAYFVYGEKPFSAAIVLFWVASAIIDVYIYAADAQVMRLPLLSGLTGAEGGFHDWNYLLSETNLLSLTKTIAKIIRLAGTLVTIAAVIGAIYYAREGEEILSENL